jgi:hypothetical protein
LCRVTEGLHTADLRAAKTPLEGVSSTVDCDGVASSELLDGVERLRFHTPLIEPDVQMSGSSAIAGFNPSRVAPRRGPGF